MLSNSLSLEVLKKLDKHNKDVLAVLKTIASPIKAYELENDIIQDLLFAGFIDQPIKTSEGHIVINVSKKGREYLEELK